MKASMAFAVVACLVLACGPASQLIRATQPASQTPPSESPVIPRTATSPAPTKTVQVESPTVPEPTDTPVPETSTPDATMAVYASELPPSLSLMMSQGSEAQYMNPVGTPLKSWQDIPIMPEATDGQAFGANVYSFKANATLAQARSFYDKAHLSMAFGMTEPVTGSSGSGVGATHSVTYMLTNGFVDINALDSDPEHVVVVIEIQ